MDTKVIDRGDNKRAVEKIVMLLAGCFCNEQTAVTCRTVEKAVLVLALGLVLRADGVVGAKFAKFQCVPYVLVNPAADLNQPAKSTFRVGGAGIEQHTITNVRQRIDSFPNRARRIATFQGNSRDQKVRK